MNILALNIVKLRKWVGITQKQLAESLGVGTTTVNNIETGYLTAVSDKLLEKIAGVFDTTVDGLLGKAPLEVSEQAKMVYVLSSVDSKNSLQETSRIVDGVFVDRKKLRGYEWFGLKINDNSLEDIGIRAGYTAIVKSGAPIKNKDIVVAVAGEDKEAVVRIYHKQGDIITLKANSSSGLYRDIVIDTKKEHCKILGKVEKCEFEL